MRTLHLGQENKLGLRLSSLLMRRVPPTLPKVTTGSLLLEFLKESRASTSKAVGKNTITTTAQKKEKKPRKVLVRRALRLINQKPQAKVPQKKSGQIGVCFLAQII